MYKVMFVCEGNICRSPMAQAVFQRRLQESDLRHHVKVESSGVVGFHEGENADPRARKELSRHGIRFFHRARQLCRADLTDYDLILTMDRSNFETVRRMATGPQLEKVHMFRDFDPLGSGEVPDPYYGPGNGFEKVYEMIERTSDRLIDVIRDRIGGSVSYAES